MTFCTLCDRQFYGQTQLRNHLDGLLHTRRAAQTPGGLTQWIRRSPKHHVWHGIRRAQLVARMRTLRVYVLLCGAVLYAGPRSQAERIEGPAPAQACRKCLQARTGGRA